MLLQKQEIVESLSTIPELPGCYTYRDERGVVIYVGKAKNLRRRLSSYFQRTPEDRKTRALLRSFATVEYIVVKSEHDALLLENNLIKQYQPVYNVLLKEGDTYPYICIKNEPFPRVFVTHKYIRDGSEYYGPYPSPSMAWTIISLFRRIFKFRTCSLNLNEEDIAIGKFKVCLKYHIDRCNGPCEGFQSKEEYDRDINEARKILKGEVGEVKQRLKREIGEAAAGLDFERAGRLQETISQIEGYQAKSMVMSDVIGDALVVSAASDLKSFYINYFEIHEGSIIAGRTLEYRKRIEEEESHFFATAIVELLNLTKGKVKELILPYEPEFSDFPGVTITIPQRGDRRKVLDLSMANVRQYMRDKHNQAEKLNPEQRNTQILRELQSFVGLPKLPYHVEAFDNSNTLGTNPIAACVVFKGAMPSKRDYRLYHIRGVSGPDDYASMEEVVIRRYSRMQEEGSDLPDLIVTDGGKGHMSTVKSALESIGVDIPVMGLAKDDRHNTNQVLYGDPPQVVGIMQRSQVFFLLERIQNEVHRFAIKFHRDERSKSQRHSILDEIQGIGPVNKKKLLRTFKSVKRIREASLEELQSAIGEVKGKEVYNFFQDKAKE
ncbi:MAG: excinuclease ABC subunit UvrC [Porphyromonas sp.]|nr:excinuclease ABC subunit UvrC [Porphyromonas sp.]